MKNGGESRPLEFEGIELDEKRKVILNQPVKRHVLIERVICATVGLYGCLPWAAGKSLQEIEGPEMNALNAPTGS